MLISCEIPNKYLNQLYPLIDFPFLINIYRNNPVYREFYIESCRNAPISFLDTGFYEKLVHKLDIELTDEALLEGIDIFHPKYVIANEVLGDREKTIDCIKRMRDLVEDKAQVCGVVHGCNFNEEMKCFEQYQDLVDIIAIPHTFVFNEELVNLVPSINVENDTLRRSLFRIYVVNEMLKNGSDKPVHLLGVNSPLEVLNLSKNKCILSVDTSSPIQCGLKGVRYNHSGILPHEKIFQEPHYIELIEDLTEQQFNDIKHNMNVLRGI